ncbi:HdeD family acid-resistance protein [Mesorhizobium xinjiangense]|uniref:HdeD family acid-resistance protein n=1 Tax=Mesorhizobium xinjiangense TaxID=2678685 RepID=UPI0012EDB2A8|nr:HdeD family acid-resistance protein [Mesorhizobium xinjiangense]
MTGTEPLDPRNSAAVLQSKWAWFLVLGLVLALCGVAAVALPALSTFAASTVLGAGLVIAGSVKMIQSLQVKEWSGFLWQEFAGAVEVVGGILIYFFPFKGAFAITLLIALVLLVHGILQIGLAVKLRNQEGWKWLAASGLIAVLASAALTLKLPYTRYFTPGTIAGIALLMAGCAYVAIALTMRRAKP